MLLGYVLCDASRPLWNPRRTDRRLRQILALAYTVMAVISKGPRRERWNENFLLIRCSESWIHRSGPPYVRPRPRRREDVFQGKPVDASSSLTVMLIPVSYHGYTPSSTRSAWPARRYRSSCSTSASSPTPTPAAPPMSSSSLSSPLKSSVSYPQLPSAGQWRGSGTSVSPGNATLPPIHGLYWASMLPRTS